MPTLVHRIAVDTDAVIFNALARTTQGVLMGVWLQRSANTVFGVGATTPGVLAAALRPKGHDVRRLGVRRLLAMRSDTDARVVPLRRIGAVCLMSPMAAGALGRLDYALFAAAAQHAGAATTTVLFEMWPLVMVLMVPAQSRYRAAGMDVDGLSRGADGSSGLQLRHFERRVLDRGGAGVGGCVLGWLRRRGGPGRRRCLAHTPMNAAATSSAQTRRLGFRRSRRFGWLRDGGWRSRARWWLARSSPRRARRQTCCCSQRAQRRCQPRASRVHKAQPPTGGAHDETLRQTPR